MFALTIALSLALLFAQACGEDSEKTYAGLSVAQASAPDGLSYRLRYLNPPWEKSDRDPLITGSDTGVELRGVKDQPFIAGTAIVLEVERESIVSGGGRTKYHLEATLIACDLTLDAGESCAKAIAYADNDARVADGEPSFYEGSVKERSNDFAQKYYELITRNMETQRYKRVAFYDTPDASRFLRVYIESNPRLDEDEVDRMLDAVELFEGDAPASGDAGAQP